MNENGMRLTCYRCGTGMTKKAEVETYCNACASRLSVYRARFCYIGNSTKLSKLMDGPVSPPEINKSSFYAGRQYVEKLSITTSVASRHGKASPVFYLPGDERAAIRLFIEENVVFMKSAMGGEGHSNIFRQQWPDHFWQMLEEQWDVSEYSDFGEAW